MSSTRVESLLYESAAALRLVDRELESLRDIAWPASSAHETRQAQSTANVQDAAGSDEAEEVAHYDRSELLAGLDRVSRLLNDAHPAAANHLPTQSA